MSWALDTPGVELVLVDRSTDHVFQWDRRDTAPAEPPGPPPAWDPGENTTGQVLLFFFFSSRRRHTRLQGDWSQTCALPILAEAADRRARGEDPRRGTEPDIGDDGGQAGRD